MNEIFKKLLIRLLFRLYAWSFRLNDEEKWALMWLVLSSHYAWLEMSLLHLSEKYKRKSLDYLANWDEERARDNVLKAVGIEEYLLELRAFKDKQVKELKREEK